MCKSLKKLIIIFFILSITIISFNSSGYGIQQIKNKKNIYTDPLSISTDIIIPDDFPSIQQGINHANPGDTIFVRSGIYKESIRINKKGLYLLGENKFNTIIDIDNNKDDAVVISKDNITFQGFTVTNARGSDESNWNQSGIVIISSNVTIKNNIISENRFGLMSYTTAYNLTISDNMFIHDGIFPASYIRCYKDYIECTDNIPIESIMINVTNNTVNGKTLYFLKNVHDTNVKSDAGQVILVNCTNVTVKNQYFSNIDFSIMLYFCSNCTIENNTIADVEGELILFFSENNTVQNNTISNAFHAICLDIGAKNNIVRYNNINNNLQGITIITACSGNIIYGNTIHNNSWGMKITSYTENLPSHDNVVCENEFYNNNVGIVLLITFKNPLCFTLNNTITKNTFFKNKIGIQISSSEGNNVTNNIFKRNLVSAVFFDCKQNYWNDNYWNHPRFLPKPIIGFKMINKIPIPCWLNFDKNPAKNV